MWADFLKGFSPVLSPWHWAVLAAIPPLVVALYFLKLRRKPVQVPSTYLWKKSIEDLHVNSLWQRLRQSLLLYLQLLLLILLMLALLRPSWEGSKLAGDRFIFLIDASASMAARDVAPSRLEEAKRQAYDLINSLESNQTALVISYSDNARVEAMFTSNRKELRRAVEGIQQTNRSTSLKEALQVAAGLANPSRDFEKDGKRIVNALPATMYIFSDGKAAAVSNFSLENLTPKYVAIGKPDAANVAVADMSWKKNEEKTGEMQIFARLENHGDADVTLTAELLQNEQLIDAQELTLKAHADNGTVFDVGEIAEAVFHLRLVHEDSLPQDNEAWTVVNPPSLARILCITPGNEPLQFAMNSNFLQDQATITFRPPSMLEEPATEYTQAASAGEYDLIIYDRVAPKNMPQANTLFIGRLPPSGGWTAEKSRNLPKIIDVDRSHPLMNLIALGDVDIAEGTPLKPPPNGKVLIDSHVGPMVALAPRERYEDIVTGFVLVDEKTIGTNWPLRPSFPVFILNLIQQYGRELPGETAGKIQPGSQLSLRVPSGVQKVEVKNPKQESLPIVPDTVNSAYFSQTEALGVYEVLNDGKSAQRFAVNLFDGQESNLKPAEKLDIGWIETHTSQQTESAPKKIWKFILMGGLGLLLFEWYIYNRRLYL